MQIGWDITEFINRAYKAADRIQTEISNGALPLPPTTAVYEPKFKEYIEFYLKYHPDGSYHSGATVVFNTGCQGPNLFLSPSGATMCNDRIKEMVTLSMHDQK